MPDIGKRLLANSSTVKEKRSFSMAYLFSYRCLQSLLASGTNNKGSESIIPESNRKFFREIVSDQAGNEWTCVRHNQ